MQPRTIAFVLSIVGIFYSGFVSALGLGEITLKSQFNQPLSAEIRLLKVRDLSEDEIFSALASREDFRLVGVDRLFFLSSFDFDVVLTDPANPFIKITSSKPITEPYLNFLVEVQWPSGRLLREYTLLLDLPVFNEASASAPVNLPSSVAVASPVPVTPALKSSRPQTPIFAPSPTPLIPERAPKVNLTPVTPKLSVESTSTVARVGIVEVDDYKVKSGDTLWQITEGALADSSASVNQKMVAILRANPDAFVKGNINRLKNGRLLRIPTNEEVANIGYRQAMDVVREQNQAWSTNKQSAQKAVLISAAPTAPGAQTSAPVEGRLTLGSADSGESNVKGSGMSGRGESLQNDLAIANDGLARSTRQNEELSLRVAELQAQIETMESLIAVTSDQLKALEFASKNSIDEEARASNVGLTSTPTESLTEPDKLDSEPAAPAAPESINANDLVTAQQPSFVETAVDVLKTNMLFVSVAALVFLVAVLVFLRLKKKPEDDLEDFALAGEEDNIFDLNEEDLDDLSPLDDEAYVEEDGFLMDEDSDEAVRAQTEDVVAEADIYVSLGQEDKAIELLQKEIQENPDNAHARLGLLAIYAKSKNSTGFDEQYAQLLPLGNVYANDQAMALRKQIENAEPFDTDQYSLKDDGLDFSDEVDSSDLGLDLDTDKLVVSTDDDSMIFSETETDFDLDGLPLDLDDVADVAADTKDNKMLSESADTDFALDLDESSSTLNDDAIGSAELEVDDAVADFDFSLDLNETSDAESTEIPTSNEFEVDASDEMEVDLDLDLDEELEDSLALEDTVVTSTLADEVFDLDVDNEFSLDIDDDFTLDDEPSLHSSAVRVDDDLASDFNFDLDDDLDAELSLDDDPSSHPSAVRVDDDLADDFSFDFDDDLDVESSFDDDLDTSSFSTDISSDDGLGNDFSVQIDEDDVGDVDDLEFDIPADGSEDLSLSLDDDIDSFDVDAETAGGVTAANKEIDADDNLDLNSPPPTDIDMATLDKEIEAMTVGMDALSEDDLVEPTATLETSNLEADRSPETSRDEGHSVTPDLHIADANEDTSVSADDELDFFEESDEVSTKLDLAKAYMDMGDREGAEEILKEVMEEGSDTQKFDAEWIISNS
jgi:pilus assembly protein FimV